MLTAERLSEAFKVTAARRARVQGFLYEKGTVHVVRDFGMPSGHDELWRERFALEDYDAGHEAMMHAVELAQFQIVVDWLAASPPPEPLKPVGETM